MAGRSPIFSAKQNRYQIGYIEGGKAFDLFGRKRCNYCARSGNLRDPDSGTIVGYVSLQGKLIGASWVIDQLFPNSDGNHQEIRRREDQRDEQNRVVTLEIYERPPTENTQAANGAAEPPRTPASDNGQSVAKLLAISEATCADENLRAEDYLDSPGLVVADNILERREPNDAYELHSIGENPTPPSSAPDQFAGELFSNSDGNPDHETLAKDGPLHDPTHVGGAIYEQFDTKRFDTKDADAASGINETPSSAFFDEDKSADRLLSDSNANLQQPILLQEHRLLDLSPSAAVSIYEQHDPKDIDATTGGGEAPSLPSLQQDEAATELLSNSALLSDSDDDPQQPIILHESWPHDPSRVITDKIYEQYDSGGSSGAGEAPSSPSFKQDEAAAELLSNSVGNPHQLIPLQDRWLHDLSRIVTDEIYEQVNDESSYLARSTGKVSDTWSSEQSEAGAEQFSNADHNVDDRGGSSGAGEAPSSPSFKQDEAAAELLSDSVGNPHQLIPLQDRWLHDLSRIVTDEIYEQVNDENSYLARSIGKVSDTWSSEQSEAGAEQFSNADHNVDDQKIAQEQDCMSGPSLLTDEIVEQNEADNSVADRGARKISTRTPFEQCEFATVPIVPGGQSATDPTEAFFSVDLERSIGLVRRGLGSESYGNGPGDVVSPETPDPTKGFFSVSLERAVEIVRRELGNEGHQKHSGDGSPEMPDSTRNFFSVDLARALEKFRKELDKEQ